MQHAYAPSYPRWDERGSEDSTTLSDVIARHQHNLSLPATRRRDVVCAVSRMSEITGAELESTPASLQFMRPLINAVRPAQHDLTPKTWANLRSNFRAALVQPMPLDSDSTFSDS